MTGNGGGGWEVDEGEGKGAEAEAEGHKGDGVEEDTAAADAVDAAEGNEGKDEVCEGHGEGGQCWRGEADKGEDCGGEIPRAYVS